MMMTDTRGTTTTTGTTGTDTTTTGTLAGGSEDGDELDTTTVGGELRLGLGGEEDRRG